MNFSFTRFLILAACFLMAPPVVAGCFHQHLIDALKINRERKPMYSALTAGKSEEVSEALIHLEQRMLGYQKVFNFDRLAKAYEEKGVHISCDSVIDMKETPAFRGSFIPASSPVSTAKLALALPHLGTLFATHQDEAFFRELQNILKELSREPKAHCLYRHFIESIARVAALQPRHTQQALEKGLPAPQGIHRQMILGHLVLLPTVLRIDGKALPLNLAGIPIICDDVPHIPLPE